MDRYRAIEHRNKQLVTIYNCGGMDDYFYGYMAPDTGYIKVFGLKYYHGGIIIRFPDKSSPRTLPEFIEQEKLFNIYLEFKRWGRILEIENVGQLNALVKEGRAAEIIRIAEALHEKKIASIADMIAGSGHKNGSSWCPARPRRARPRSRSARHTAAGQRPQARHDPPRRLLRRP